ncbi:MAG: hypothetical protein R3A80_09010 [Bdellovibrionota bacterium]
MKPVRIISFVKILTTFAMIVLTLFVNGCASRGFHLSQQMPGIDDNLNPIFKVMQQSEDQYFVSSKGKIEMDTNVSHKSQVKRSISSSTFDQSNTTNVLLFKTHTLSIKSTLDPKNGAYLLN